MNPLTISKVSFYKDDCVLFDFESGAWYKTTVTVQDIERELLMCAIKNIEYTSFDYLNDIVKHCCAKLKSELSNNYRNTFELKKFIKDNNIIEVYK